jgi:long-chain acyl-CoA synthetase
MAAVQLLPGTTFDEAAARAALAAGLARYKVPKRIVPVEEMPRNTLGKIRKNLLQQRFAGLFTSGAV